jgi:hypothetical protein
MDRIIGISQIKFFGESEAIGNLGQPGDRYKCACKKSDLNFFVILFNFAGFVR